MILAVQIDEQTYDVDVPKELIKDAEEFYRKIDEDMDEGWQLGRDWISRPDALQRCQIVADKILDGFEKENEQLVIMMCGYILSRMPSARQINIDTNGEAAKTEIIT
ncbi:MAG: hypothetical protein OEZ43_11125 [Gammaproteobacteria bacterium]|nr:hypothetical protein [Gammaproteobacteria bacterium]